MTCRTAAFQERIAENVDLSLLARVAVARGVTILADAPTFTWRKRSLVERLLQDFGRAYERVPVPAAIGDREIIRIGDTWLCSPSTAAELNALSHR